MGKQKILIFVGILVLLLIAGIFYFLIKKDSIIEVKEEIPNTPLTEKQIEEKSRETLNSFQPSANARTEVESRIDLNKVGPSKDSKNRTEADAREDLLNITQ